MSGPVISISFPTHPALFNDSSLTSPPDIPDALSPVEVRRDKSLEGDNNLALAVAVGQNAAGSLNVREHRPELQPSPSVVVDAKAIKTELIRLWNDSPPPLDFSNIRDEKPKANPGKIDDRPFFSGELEQRANIIYEFARVLLDGDQKTNSELLEMNAKIRKQANDIQAQSLRDQGTKAMLGAFSGASMQVASTIVGSSTRMNGLNERKNWLKNDQGLADELREMKAGVRSTLSPGAAARLNDETLAPTRPRVDAQETASVVRPRSASMEMEPPRDAPSATQGTNTAARPRSASAPAELTAQNDETLAPTRPRVDAQETASVVRPRSASMEMEPPRDTPPATQGTNTAARPRSASAPAESTAQDAAPTTNGRASSGSQEQVRSRQASVERDGQMPSEGNEANATRGNGSTERAAQRPSERGEADVESPTPLSKDDPRLTRLIDDLERKNQLVQIKAGKQDVIGLAIQETSKAGSAVTEGVFTMMQSEDRARGKISENTEQTMSTAVDQNLSGIQQAREAALAVLSRIDQSEGARSAAFSSIADNLRGA